MEIFLSHSTKDLSVVEQMGEILDIGTISSFIAHRDIEVSSLWREKILTRLRSAKVLVVFLTKNYHPSDWTDQEVGFFMHRLNPLIICVQLGRKKPYGFLEQYQIARSTPKSASHIATLILHALAKDEYLGFAARRRIISGLCGSSSFNQAIAYSNAILDFTSLSRKDLIRIVRASWHSDQIANCAKAKQNVHWIVRKNVKRFPPRTADELRRNLDAHG